MTADAPPAPSFAPTEAYLDRPLTWLTSYPKSGNTWLRILLANVLDQHDEDDSIALLGLISSDRQTFDAATGLTSSDLTPDEIDMLRPAAWRKQSAEMGSEPVFVKAHDALYRNGGGEWLFPPDRSRGAVLIVRHPFDVAVSYMHHQGQSDPARTVRGMGDLADTMAGHRRRQFHQRTMGWSGHYLSWTRQDAIPVLVVRYEDMLADTAAQLVRVLAFLGLPQANDAARIAKTIEQSRFERMQNIENASGFVERPARSARFFRSGRSGEGRATLPQDLQTRLCADHKDVMRELGYSCQGGVLGLM